MISIEYAYQRFCRERFPLPAEERVIQLEQRMQAPLPEDYRRFVLEFNGGYFAEPEIEPSTVDCPRGVLSCLYGIGAPHPHAELGRDADLFDDNLPVQLLPIGSTPMGSLILLLVGGDEDGEIAYKKTFGDAYYLAEGIEEFFERLREPHW